MVRRAVDNDNVIESGEKNRHHHTYPAQSRESCYDGIGVCDAQCFFVFHLPGLLFFFNPLSICRLISFIQLCNVANQNFPWIQRPCLFVALLPASFSRLFFFSFVRVCLSRLAVIHPWNRIHIHKKGFCDRTVRKSGC